ncbi:hypothetical protein [Sabulicella glaciei]|uniref:Uncharacterized protein n=1 Tax=Sabulicella glaciei TaxID=2984948 RepID=A0ABT3NQW5_9PROT|nr:hypothetical protein [Roseococcus sp. MDT2-1-1]MCW8084550.1 hypothetical protein [Roseococcus sp. MDT2-1-1]
MNRLALPLLLGLAGCTVGEAPPSATLPPSVVGSVADPMRASVLSSAYVFGHPAATRPVDRARGAAMVEFMAADFRWNPRWWEYSPTVGLQLDEARAELRHAYAVPPGAPPQAVVDAMVAAGAALEAQDEAAARNTLATWGFPTPDVTLAALSVARPLPVAARATSLAQSEMMRIETQDRFSGDGGSSGSHP